jgi:hypothetical protein
MYPPLIGGEYCSQQILAVKQTKNSQWQFTALRVTDHTGFIGCHGI